MDPSYPAIPLDRLPSRLPGVRERVLVSLALWPRVPKRARARIVRVRALRGGPPPWRPKAPPGNPIYLPLSFPEAISAMLGWHPLMFREGGFGYGWLAEVREKSGREGVE